MSDSLIRVAAFAFCSLASVRACAFPFFKQGASADLHVGSDAGCIEGRLRSRAARLEIVARGSYQYQAGIGGPRACSSVGDAGAPRWLNWSAEPLPDDDVLVCAERPPQDAVSGVNLFERGFQFLRADRITPSVTFPKSQHAIGGDRFESGSNRRWSSRFVFPNATELVLRRVGEQVEERGNFASAHVFDARLVPMLL